MTPVYTAQEFIQTTAGAIIIPLVTGSILSIAGTMIKMMIDMSSLKQSIKGIASDIEEIKEDPDTMRWSAYNGSGRMKSTGRRRGDGGR